MPNVVKGGFGRAKRAVQRAFGTRRRNDWHWFDHPEMRSRIARAEDDLAHGRYTDVSAEEYLKFHSPS